VPVIGDGVVEEVEYFYLGLANPSGTAAIDNGWGIGEIRDYWIDPNAGGTISEAYVRGSTWAPAFKTYMEGQGLGDDVLGYRVNALTGNAAITPWINLDEIVLRYSAPPTAGGIPTPGTITLDGHRADYQVSSITPLDPQTFILRLNRPLGNLEAGGENGDRIQLTVSGAGAAGAAYTRTVNVLQGDVDKSGSVVAQDFSDVRKKFFRSTTNVGAGEGAYTPFHDVDGNGSIVANDFSEVKKRFFDNVPATTAGATQGAAATPVSRDLFSSTAIL
jgi:hypothetical protein